MEQAYGSRVQPGAAPRHWSCLKGETRERRKTKQKRKQDISQRRSERKNKEGGCDYGGNNKMVKIKVVPG